MDNLTHALIGVTAGRAVAGTVRRDPVWWAFLLGSEIPDIDVLYALQGRASYLLNHRGWTHSLPGLFLLAAAVALLVFAFARGSGTKFKSILFFSVLSGLVHVFIDVLTSWGTSLFKPLYAGWLALDILPMIDPIVLFLLLAGLLTGRFGRQLNKKAAKLALAVVIIFVAARGTLHFAALNFVGHDGRILALPTMNPLKWKVVAEHCWGFETGNLDLSEGCFVKTAEVRTEGFAAAGDYTVDPVLDTVLSFFRIPVFSVMEKEGRKLLLVKDISYQRGIREIVFEAKEPADSGVWYKAIKK